MPPFSSALLPLSLKEIGGLGPTEGNCVSRLPTIMTPCDVTRRRQEAPHDICHFSHNSCPLWFSQVRAADEVNATVWRGWGRIRAFRQAEEKGREVQEVKGKKKREWHRQKSAAVLPVYPGLVWDSGKRNRGCIHPFFSTSVDPLTPPSFYSSSILPQFLVSSLPSQLSLFLPPRLLLINCIELVLDQRGVESGRHGFSAEYYLEAGGIIACPQWQLLSQLLCADVKKRVQEETVENKGYGTEPSL